MLIGFCASRSIASTARKSTLSEEVVAKCYRYFDTGDDTVLSLKARSVVVSVLRDYYRKLVKIRQSVDREDIELLVLRFQHDDASVEGELYDRFRRFACTQLKGWTLPGSTYDDLIQEVMTEVFKSLSGWSPSAGSLWTYLRRVIYNAASTAVKTARRRKHEYLNHAKSLDAPRHDGDERTEHERVVDEDSAFEADLTDRLSHRRVIIDPSTYALPGTLNHALLADYLAYPDGTSFQERAERISRQIGRPVNFKALDNTRERIKKFPGLHELLLSATVD